MQWKDVNIELPDCHSQHGRDYASGYLLGFTKYGEVEITQLWEVRQSDGTYKNTWEGGECEEGGEGDHITHWMPLPDKPN